MTSFSWIPWYFKNSTHEIHGIFLIWQAGEAVLQASPDGTWTALGWKAMGPCEMPMDATGFGWFWVVLGIKVRSFLFRERSLAVWITVVRLLHSERIAPNYKKHSRQAWRPCHPCHGIIWSFNVVHFVWEGQQKHVCHHVSHWETLPSCLVWTCVNGGPCSHSRLQNLRSSSFVLGDRVGQWARNLGAWHDTRTGGTRWDVLNLTTWWCWPSKGMQSDANMILINLWNSLNFHICISLNHFCGPYSCKMYQTNVVNSC